ncbi:uncharacterized protein LOC127095740 [Lathyrus oleraceus]|uniref:uncharacterized protein LOC127095740 n=1 Tax=Pisum sativum TaxID=3888 RepID=UPI0021D10A64|nr:uncharacterized protein LOC127095740 [Pisum sativum]
MTSKAFKLKSLSEQFRNDFIRDAEARLHESLAREAEEQARKEAEEKSREEEIQRLKEAEAKALADAATAEAEAKDAAEAEAKAAAEAEARRVEESASRLMPTLEEYSHLIGVPISSQDPFFGLEEDPKDQDIPKATHLKMSEIRDHITTKGKMLGLTAKFIMNKAQYFARMRSVDAFEARFALLIYGLFLFHNFDDFVAMDVIKVFLIGNPVPTLLADAYHFVHMRNSYSGGMITCCVPMLYKCFISHLPRSHAFWDIKDGLLWS